jgi:hypothetical protein
MDARSRFESLVPEPFELSRRETRWLALADDVLAFGADGDAGWRRLEQESWLIDRWRAAGIPVPRVIRDDPVRRVQIRERLHGLTGETVEPRIYEGALRAGALPAVSDRLDGHALSAFGRRLAASYGELARQIREAVSVDDAKAMGLGMCSHRTLDIDDAIGRLHATAASDSAKQAANHARGWLTAVPPADAVIHGDLHFFNMCLAEDGSITGIFDLGDAGIEAAATELLYVESLGSRFMATALDAYGPISVDDVRRAHIRIALGHLIWHPPGSPRHESVVSWVSAALERL